MEMEAWKRIFENLYGITRIPLTLVTGDLKVLRAWPSLPENLLRPEALELVLTDFRLQKRDALHPLISHLDPGFFLGVCMLEENLYALIGLVSQVPHSRQEILKLCAPVIAPSNLQPFCDFLIRMPPFSLEQVQNLICVLVQMVQGAEIPQENIRFNDLYLTGTGNSKAFAGQLFEQREKSAFHVPTDFESAICHAIENGNRSELTKVLYAPFQGQVGRMSANPLRQEKYSFVCLATLISRAAIRGGLPEELAFNMSDSFCQAADQMRDIPQLQQLSISMMTDYCDQVKLAQAKRSHSDVIQKALDYITVHLHDSITLDDLSTHCGLCGRSLSLRFRQEIGMGIPEYIHREKIREAKYLLRHTGYTLSEISCLLNYPSQSYFTQIFKKYSGKTPQQYRDRPVE